MTAVLIIIMFVAFVGIDFLVRTTLRRMRDSKERQDREAVLKTSIRLDFTHEAKSLKRVEVPNPKARILAVDDEAVVLDSFRRILVLEGFSVDTVEHGPEALGLVQRRDYDFVFTDLKMPDMDGVDVVKGVKHLRPDVDVVVITGYGSIETAVQTLQQGACEYVQKPFTADELGDFAKKLVIKREARIQAAQRPTVRMVSPEMAEVVPAAEFCVPGGAFLSAGHAWVRIEPEGQVRIGIDDFMRKALGTIKEVELPERGKSFRQGEPLFTLKGATGTVQVLAPVSGRIEHDNAGLKNNPGELTHSPYDRGWVCLMTPSDLASELTSLKIGKPVIDWYQDEIARLRTANGPDAAGPLDWTAFQKQFLAAGETTRV
ncbi:MAG: response regulator [Holophagaceae bacterium]|uniref:Response regulator n=1 Tax=Candidatus Geothrix skivensis TaxID=2954439 RepID=A0A9D7SG04_9BACT|nr:response regulator [Candidatus Geothrix skivensis]